MHQVFATDIALSYIQAPTEKLISQPSSFEKNRSIFNVKSMKKLFILWVASSFLFACQQTENKSGTVSTETNGAVLPFPPVPSASTAGESLSESKHVRRAEPNHLPKDAPNILIVLMDDVGFGTSSTFGGEINTPTFSKVYNEGIAYNEFHTTAICSPTRAALLTGRNHTRIGNGTIAERAVDWDGFTGIIPKEAATALVPRTGDMPQPTGK
jgi:hypothetical protein